MDNFEKHIREKAADFDDYQVDRTKLWAKISEELDVGRPKVVAFWKLPALRIAASIVLLLGIGSLIGLQLLSSGTHQESHYASRELLDIDTHYKALVAHQVNLVRRSPNLTATDKEEFLSFMDELDAEYRLLRAEMHKNLDNERVLEAIIYNYKKRIELIENLLKQINDAKLNDDDYGYIL